MEQRQVKHKKDLTQILLEGAFIRSSDLQAAQEKAHLTGKNLTEVLLKENMVTHETLATVLSFQFNAPIVDLNKFDVQPQALTAIPETIATENHILPLAVNGDELTLAMEDPGNQQLIDSQA